MLCTRGIYNIKKNYVTRYFGQNCRITVKKKLAVTQNTNLPIYQNISHPLLIILDILPTCIPHAILVP